MLKFIIPVDSETLIDSELPVELRYGEFNGVFKMKIKLVPSNREILCYFAYYNCNCKTSLEVTPYGMYRIFEFESVFNFDEIVSSDVSDEYSDISCVVNMNDSATYWIKRRSDKDFSVQY